MLWWDLPGMVVFFFVQRENIYVGKLEVAVSTRICVNWFETLVFVADRIR